MKITKSLSAFAIYNQGNNTNNISKSPNKRKIKLKAKYKYKVKKVTKNPKQLNLSNVLTRNKEDNVKFIAKSGKVQSNKLKDKISPKVKSGILSSTPTKKTRSTIKISKKPKLGESDKSLVENMSTSEGSPNFHERKKVLKVRNTLKQSPENRIQHVYSKSNAASSSADIYYDPSPSAQDPIMKGHQLFEWMIDPMLPKYFFERYWEREPLYVARSNKKYFTHLLTSRHLDQIFRQNNLHYTKNVDVVVYENEEKEVLNLEGRATPAALWDFYSNGCSIRVLNPQTYNKKVHLLVSTLQEYFGSMVGVNVYLTPPGSQGFAPHFDDIEAFVIQLEGRKHWKLYQPKEEDVLARHSSKNFTHQEIGNPFLEVALEEGSLLYFPRGVIHEGRTDSDSHSLHITVSLYQNNAYVDLLEKALPNALAKAAKSDLDFRKGLPLHFLRSEDAKQIIVEKVADLMEKLKDHLDIDTGLNALGRKLVYDSMPPILTSKELACSSGLDGDMLDNGVVYNKVVFDLATKIRLTRYHCIQLVFDDEMKPRLYYSTENANVYHGEEEQSLELEPCMVPAIQALQRAYPFFTGVGFLPIEGIDLKIQFVYDLWEKGIVITKKPLSHSSNAKEATERKYQDTSDSE